MENGHFPCSIILGVFCFFGPTEINLLDLVIPKKNRKYFYIGFSCENADANDREI